MKRTFIYIGCLLMAAGTVATSCSEDETAELSSSIYPGDGYSGRSTPIDLY